MAELYGVKTKEINQAVRNNPRKFPYGYLFELDKYEQMELVKNFDHLNKLKYIVMPDLQTTETESTIEINFVIGKINHTVKRVRREESKK